MMNKPYIIIISDTDEMEPITEIIGYEKDPQT